MRPKIGKQPVGASGEKKLLYRSPSQDLLILA
jgi:hypothetical protein